MGTTPIGNNIWEGPIGVVRIIYDSVDYGKTTADTELIKNEDVKDITYQQDGTQYYDKVPTGISYQLQVTFGEIDTALLAKMHDSITLSGGAGNSLKVGKKLYHSWLEQAKLLEFVHIDEDGDASSDPLHKAKAPKAYPEITSNIIWGADTQRSVQITFHIFFDSTEKLFLYSGYATSLGITP